MIQEEKQLLLKDLCARLPYGVIMNTPNGDGYLNSINQTIFGNEYGINIKLTKRDYFNDEKINFKPYLRPLDSMSDEEEEEFTDLVIRIDLKDDSAIIELVDWLIAHHFDVRDLVEEGLAIAVTPENNPYETN